MKVNNCPQFVFSERTVDIRAVAMFLIARCGTLANAMGGGLDGGREGCRKGDEG